MPPNHLGDELRQLIEALPASEERLLAVVRRREVRGDSRGARDLLLSAVAAHPTQNLRKSLAAIHLKLGQPQQAVTQLYRVIETDPADVPTLVLLAHTLLETGQGPAAVRFIEEAASRGAPAVQIDELRQKVGKRSGPPPTPTHDTLHDTLNESSSAAASGTPALPDGHRADPEDSTLEGFDSIFESGTFSNLSSVVLAEGAEKLEKDDPTSSLFETLVDPNYEPPTGEDRSFDALLSELGVPVETVRQDAAAVSMISEGEFLSDDDPTISLGQSRVDDDDPTVTLGGEAGPDDPTEAVDIDIGSLREQWSQAAPAGGASEPAAPGRQGPASGVEFDDLDAQPTQIFDESDGSASEHDIGELSFPDEPATSLETPGRRSLAQPPRQQRRPAPKPAAAQAQRSGDRRADRPMPGGAASPDDSLDDALRGAPEPPKPATMFQRAEPPADRANAAVDLSGAERLRPGPRGRVAPPTEKNQAQRAPRSRRADSFVERHFKALVTVLSLLIVAALLTVAFAATSAHARAVTAHANAAAEAQRHDTYEGYLSAHSELEAALDEPSFLGSFFDATVAPILPDFPAESAAERKAEARRQLAALSAMIEYRYEQAGTRRAAERIAALQATPGQSPEAAVASVYQLLADGRADEAVDVARQSRSAHPNDYGLVTALLWALLDAGKAQAASIAAAPLRAQAEPSVAQQFVLARIDRTLGKKSADDRLATLLGGPSPSHLSARIERSYTLRLGEASDADFDRARALLEEVLGPKRELASPLQRARAHVALGQIFLVEGERARAEEQFRDAIKLIPGRADVYDPLVVLYLEDGRIDQALERLETASDKGARSPALALREAEIKWLTGRVDAALDQLEDLGLETGRAKLLEGLVRLDAGEHEAAAEAFAAADEYNDELAEARAFGALAEELGSHDARQSLPEPLERLVSKFSNNPQVLRAAALAGIHAATTTRSSGAQAKFLETAQQRLETALELSTRDALLYYDLCRLHLLAGNGPAAAGACRQADRLNDAYLPGQLTLARLRLHRGEDTEALEQLGELARRFPESAEVSLMKARGHLAVRDIEAAQSEVNRWVGTPVGKQPASQVVEGRIAFTRDAYSTALAYLQRAHDQAPHDAEAAVFYAHTLARIGEYDKARAIVKDLTGDALWDGYAWLVYGELRRRQGRLSDASENLGLALEHMRESVAPPAHIALAYAELARTAAARWGWDHRYVQRYLDRGADRGEASHPALHYVRGEYYLERRRPDLEAAADAFERVVDAEPYNCAALVTLDRIWTQLEREAKRESVARLREEHCED